MVKEIQTVEYINKDGVNHFRTWFDGIKDRVTQQIIDARLVRVRRGLLGNCRQLGEALHEIKVDYGPGFRVYFTQQGQKVVILLAGGDKKTQKRDIKLAQFLCDEFKERNLKND